MQACSAADYEIPDKYTTHKEHHLYFDEKPWNIGLIVGRSGIGKTQLARKLFPQMERDITREWPETSSIIDALHSQTKKPVSDITGTLTKLGFGTIPNWCLPFSRLSNGEKMRVDLTRLILMHRADSEPIVMDEYTSVVDRQIGKIVSINTAKIIRKSHRKFVAVSCHYDIIDWLQPDWVYDLNTEKFSWRTVLPHPRLIFNIYRCSRKLWPLFSPYHYMSGTLPTSAKCWILTTPSGDLCAFTSAYKFPHPTVNDIYMGTRLVVLPDWQGIGIASMLETWLGEYLHSLGYRYRNAVAHPGMKALYSASSRWKNMAGSRNKKICAGSRKSSMRKTQRKSRRLSVVPFEYMPCKTEISNLEILSTPQL